MKYTVHVIVKHNVKRRKQNALGKFGLSHDEQTKGKKKNVQKNK